MNRLLITLFGTVSTVSVTILLVLLYRYAAQSQPIEAHASERVSYEFSHSSEDVNHSSTQSWLKEMAHTKRPSFSYAVSEMELELPLKTDPKIKQSFRIILSDLDNYKMFCIRQLLSQEKIKFSMFRKEKNGILMVHDLEGSELERILKIVHGYNIKTKIENYTKD